MTNRLAAPKSRRTRIPQSILKRSHLVECTKDFSLNLHPSAKEAIKYRELFYSLILKTERSERKLIAQYLSRTAHTPRPIAIYFGLDDIDNAAPMLLFSPVLQATDMKRIIDKQSIQHSGVIARRNDLETQTIHDLLLRDDSQGTLRNLLHRNPSIKRDEETSALMKQTTQELRSAMENETQSEPQASLQSLKPLTASQPLKSIEVTPQPHAQKPKDLSKDLMALARKDTPYRAKDTKFNKIISEGEKLGKRMLGYAREHDYEGLTLLIHKTCLLEWEKVGSLLRTNNTGLQTTLLRALDIPVKEASQLMLLINLNIGRNLDVFKLIMLKYEKLGVQECQELYQKQGAVFGELQPTKTNQDADRKHFSTLLTQRRNSILSSDTETIKVEEEAQTLKRA